MISTQFKDETRTNCPYAATFWVYIPLARLYIYVYIFKYIYTHIQIYIYTYIYTCSTLKFFDNIFIEDSMPEKVL